MKSTKLMNMLNKKKDFWTDSETDLLSPSDNDSNTASTKSVTIKASTNEIPESSKINCCLICSILSSLSNINCCPKHLGLLTTSLSSPIIYKMPPQVSNWPKFDFHHRLHCLKSKRTGRFRSLSLSSLKSQYRRKKRSVTLQSFNTRDTNDYLLSPNRERSTSPYIESRRRPAPHRSNHVQTLLSPSLIMNNNNSRKRTRTLSNPILTKRKQQTIDQIETTVQTESTQQTNNPSTSSDSIELDTDLLYIPRIPLKRIIYVKDDDDEELILNTPQIILNMAQATKQMSVQKDAQPKILLKRVCLEQYNDQ